MKLLLVFTAGLVAALAALWFFAPLVFYSLLVLIMSLGVAVVAPVMNAIVPAPEQRLRVEASIVVDGAEYRAAGVTSCREGFEAVGSEGAMLGRRMRLNGGYITLDLPDGRLVQSSAIDTCAESEFAARRDKLAFYLVNRRGTPARAWSTTPERSAANRAAPFRVTIVAAGATTEAPTDPARRSRLPSDIHGPRAIEDIELKLTSYVALAIPREVWVAHERLRADYGALTEFRAVPRPPADVLRQLVARTETWPASTTLRADHSRIDLPDFDAPPVAVAYVALADTGYTGPRRDLPVPQTCIAAGRCVPFPVFGSEVSRLYTRNGYFFDPGSQRLIAVLALFGGRSVPTKDVFER